MDTLNFKQNKSRLIIFVALAYFFILFLILFQVIGWNNAANFVNSFSSQKSIGIVFSLIVLGPFFIILSLLSSGTKVEFQSDTLVVFEKNKPPKTIHIKEIAYMIQDKPKPGQLNLYNASDAPLYSFHPIFKGNIIIPQLIKFITKKKEFKVEEMNHKIAFGVSIKAKKFTA